MATFGVFDSSDTEPVQVYEGDYLQLEPPYSIIYKYTSGNRSTAAEVAHIHLAKGQAVKEVPAGTQVGYANPRVR
jgi:hypothetical protein